MERFLGEWLDRTVGLEYWPGPEEVEASFIDVWLQIKVDVSPLFQQLMQIGAAAGRAAGKAAAMQKAMNQIQAAAQAQQSQYTLWPPLSINIKQFTMPSRRDDQRLDNEFWQQQASRRTRKLSRPIGASGCGFVWNRGRFT